MSRGWRTSDLENCFWNPSGCSREQCSRTLPELSACKNLGTDCSWRKPNPTGDGSHNSFTFEPRSLEDFAARCSYHQTSPDSHFMQNRICTRATPEGRVTLSELNLITTRNGRREEKTLASEEERQRVLREQFGITV